MSWMKSIVASLLFPGWSSPISGYPPKAARAYATRWHVPRWHGPGHTSDPPYAIERKRVLMRSESIFSELCVRPWDSADLNGTSSAFIVHITRRAVMPVHAGNLPFVGVGREFVDARLLLVHRFDGVIVSVDATTDSSPGSGLAASLFGGSAAKAANRFAVAGWRTRRAGRPGRRQAQLDHLPRFRPVEGSHGRGSVPRWRLCEPGDGSRRAADCPMAEWPWGDGIRFEIPARSQVSAPDRVGRCATGHPLCASACERLRIRSQTHRRLGIQ